MREMRHRKAYVGIHSAWVPGVGKGKDPGTLGFARMDPEQMKEARLNGIVALGKRAGLLKRTLRIKMRGIGQ